MYRLRVWKLDQQNIVNEQTNMELRQARLGYTI